MAGAKGGRLTPMVEVGEIRDGLGRPAQLPESLRRMYAGNRFNEERSAAYLYNEVYINNPSGSGYVRVDSYNPGIDIVSRKNTQFSEISLSTGIKYIDELTIKYPDGATIANVRTNRDNGLAGQLLRGQQILETPVQTNPIPLPILDYAGNKGIVIRDPNGKTY